MQAAEAGAGKAWQTLLTRQFVRDLARLVEGIIMYDAPNVWAATEGESRPVLSREKSAPLVATSLNGMFEKPEKKAKACALRHKVVEWAADLRKRYSVEFVDWVDSGVEQEKQALVLRLKVAGRSVIVVAWRGSKSVTDWCLTDFDQQFIQLHRAKAEASRSWWPRMGSAHSSGAAQHSAEEELDAAPGCVDTGAQRPHQATAARFAADRAREAELDVALGYVDDAGTGSRSIIKATRDTAVATSSLGLGLVMGTLGASLATARGATISAAAVSIATAKQAMCWSDVNRSGFGVEQGDNGQPHHLSDGGLPAELPRPTDGDEGEGVRVGAEGEGERVDAEGEGERAEGEGERVGAEGEGERVGAEGEGVRVGAEGAFAAAVAFDPAVAEEPEEDGLRQLWMPLLSRSSVPCVSKGVWRAYAGSKGRTSKGLSPRAKTRAAVQRLLERDPDALLLSTGHSLGGTLASLFAYDVLTSLSLRPEQGVACVAFAPTRSFNGAFRQAWGELVRAGRLFALRVVNVGDMVPLLPYDVPLYNTVHAIEPRLLLDPTQGAAKPLALAPHAPADDKDLRRFVPDPTSHTMHSGLLGAEIPAGRKRTVPDDIEWPLSMPKLSIWSMESAR